MGATAENVMMGVVPEELFNIPTAEYINRRGWFVDKKLTVYHAASHALADLCSVEVIHGYSFLINFFPCLKSLRYIFSMFIYSMYIHIIKNYCFMPYMHCPLKVAARLCEKYWLVSSLCLTKCPHIYVNGI